VTASSNAGAGQMPAQAIDGNLSTRWSTGTLQAKGQYFQIDLGSSQSFSKLVLDTTNSPNDYPRGYAVYVSNDGQNWGNAIASGSGSSAVTTITFPTVAARYIKIVQTGSSTSWWWSIHELNVYTSTSTAGSGSGGSGSTGSNTPLNRSGWSVTASSNAGAGQMPAQAIDGNLSTHWSTGTPQATGQYFQLDLGSSQSFSKLVLDATNSPNDYPKGYAVYVSNDGQNWGSAIASGSGSSAVTTITFPTVAARYVKIVQTVQTGSTGWWWTIDELNVYT